MYCPWNKRLELGIFLRSLISPTLLSLSCLLHVAPISSFNTISFHLKIKKSFWTPVIPKPFLSSIPTSTPPKTYLPLQCCCILPPHPHTVLHAKATVKLTGPSPVSTSKSFLFIPFHHEILLYSRQHLILFVLNERDLSTGLLPERCSQQPGLVQAKVRSLTPHPVHPVEWQELLRHVRLPSCRSWGAGLWRGPLTLLPRWEFPVLLSCPPQAVLYSAALTVFRFVS